MKKRVFRDFSNGVYRVVIKTEDWSNGDLELMARYGEPEINIGGPVSYLSNNETKTKSFGDEFVRLLHGFPYIMLFDSRDYESIEETVSVGVAWKENVLSKIDSAIKTLRENDNVLPTEELEEI